MEEKQLSLFEENWTLNESIILEFPQNESTELEYKSAAGGFPIGALETYSAFANTDGGIIVLGVSQKKGHTNFDGLDDNQIHKITVDFWNLVNNKQKVNINILINENVKEISHQGKKLLAIYVPPASRTDKPIYLNNNPLTGTYKRNYEGDYKCKDDEVKRMFADADINNHHDNRILLNYTIDDIDLESLKRYRQMFGTAKPGHAWLALDEQEFLERIGGYRKDKRTGKEGFTVASILMFGKTNSVIDPECVPTFFPDYQESLNEDPEIRWTDRIYPDGSWEVNLMQFYLKVWPKLRNSLPKRFSMKNGQRQDETTAHIALREAFVNALIHSDYTLSGQVTIKQVNEKFSFTNPGTLLVTLSQYFKGGFSECRNPVIQKMFLNIGVAEKIGSGVNKIVSGWQEAHWRIPKLIVEKSPDRIILELYTVNMLPAEILNELKTRFDGIEEFSRDEITTLALCLAEGEVTNGRLQIALKKHSYDITKMLQDFCKKGYMIQDGKARGATYHINNEYSKEVHNLEVDFEDEEEYNDDSRTITNSDSKDSNDDSKSKRLNKNELDELILQICKPNGLSAKNIADKTNKAESYIKNIVIPRLIKSGKLLRVHKEKHPQQLYIAK